MLTRDVILLALGLMSEDDFRRSQDAQRRGLRWQVARHGWSDRFLHVAQTILFALIILAFIVLIALVGSVTLAGPDL